MKSIYPHMILTNYGMISSQSFSSSEYDIDEAIYEVVRLIDGVPLFVEDHYKRLISSANLMGYSVDMELDKFGSMMKGLGEKNQIKNGNIKFVFSFSAKIEKWAFYFIPHQYPGENDYQNGVHCSLNQAERVYPGAKVIRHDFRNMTEVLLKKSAVYEMILVDQEGCITEGSRSNIFFIKDRIFYTPPAQKVLEGITRKKVMECLRKLNCKCIEADIKMSDLEKFDSAFITGTSPMVLPVNAIDNVRFSVRNNGLLKLMESYERKVSDYIADKK